MSGWEGGREAPRPLSGFDSDDTTMQRSRGFGLGLRPVHYREFLGGKQPVDWLEIISENYMVQGGKPLAMLEAIRADYPVAMHGVSMSLGSTCELDRGYLAALKAFAARIEPLWISDHVCWTGAHGANLHDLYPVPYTEEAVAHIARRIREVQDFLGRPLVVENVSTYLEYAESAMTEWEFLSALAGESDCLLLLDVNNVYVSGVNHGFSPAEYVDSLPASRIGQIHLAGHSDHGTHLLDTHDAPVVPAVWGLYRRAVARFGRVSTLVEWDDRVPELEEVLAEAERARAAEVETLARGSDGWARSA